MTITMDAETEGLARRLAHLRGETVEQAVSAAVREALVRMQDQSASSPAARKTDPLAKLTPAQRQKVERTLAMIGKLPRLGDGDPTAEFYDEYGLPN